MKNARAAAQLNQIAHMQYQEAMAAFPR